MGSVPPLSYARLSIMAALADLLTTTAQSRPDQTALIAGERSLSWRELDDLCTRWAGGLAGLGIAPGDRVGLLMGNSIDYVIAYFGTLRAGVVVVPLNPGYTAPEVTSIVHDAGARLVVCDPASEPVARAAGVDVVASQTAEWDALLASDLHDCAPVPADSLALLLFTAGTSGKPKGAMLTHASLVANVRSVQGLRNPPAILPDDISLAVLPFFHVYGLNTVLTLAVAEGATSVIVDRFDVAETLELIQRHRVTTIAGAPPMYGAWAKAPDIKHAFASVRLVTSGGAPLPVALHEKFHQLTGHSIWEGYGLTEASPVVASTLVGGVPVAGSIGQPIDGVSVRIVESGEDVDEGDPGEMWISGPSVFSGYWPDGLGGPIDGWFNTGDVAYADADGNLHIVDRRREMVLVSGFNVYPREVELVIDSMPGVAECAVVGAPNVQTGETVFAYVVPKPGASFDPADVIAHCRTSLASYKCPTTVRIVSQLPHSATGKVAKGRLRDVHGDE